MSTSAMNRLTIVPIKAARSSSWTTRPVLWLLIVTATLTGACGADPDATAFQRVGVSEFARLVVESNGNPEILLIDLRTPEEVVTGFIGTATNYNALDGEFESTLEGLDPDVHYLVYGRSNAASGEAIRQMKAANFTHITELNGGINAWTAENRSLTFP